MALVLRTLLRKATPALCARALHTTRVTRADEVSPSKFMFEMNGYNKYGLLFDDLLNELDPDIAEAIRRLPEEEQMKRLHRAIRAHQAEIAHSILPEDQWTKYEDNHYYLRPYLNEVIAEREEREEWDATH